MLLDELIADIYFVVDKVADGFCSVCLINLL